MDTPQTADILASPEAFGNYCRQVESSIRARGQERLAFMQTSVERLQALHHSAELLGDAALAGEIQGHIRAAEDRMAVLRNRFPVGT